MPSAHAKKTAAQTATKRRRPYDSKRSRSSTLSASAASVPAKTRSRTSLKPSPPSPSFSTTSTSSSPPISRMRTIRELSLQVIRKQYPYFTPRNDWEILALSGGTYIGPPEGIDEWLDSTFAEEVEEAGSHDLVMESATEAVEELVDCTGLKPAEADDPQVFVRPIPNSVYSIRLFPGRAAGRDYCLDFVRTSTGEPVNSPFKFDLFSVPDPDAPAGLGPISRLRPLECSFGIREDKIDPGEEKFLLRDGQHCVLRRLGHRDVRFTVPIRRIPQVARPPVDADFLSLPKYID